MSSCCELSMAGGHISSMSKSDYILPSHYISQQTLSYGVQLFVSIASARRHAHTKVRIQNGPHLPKWPQWSVPSNKNCHNPQTIFSELARERVHSRNDDLDLDLVLEMCPNVAEHAFHA